LVVFDRNLNYIKKVELKFLGYKFGELNDYKFIYLDNTIHIIKNEAQVLEFKNVDSSYLQGNFLLVYNKTLKRLIKINIAKALNII
jgi:hypothetical protein